MVSNEHVPWMPTTHPAVFVKSGGDLQCGFGLWRSPTGSVVQLSRGVDGRWVHASRVEYPAELIRVLWEVSSGP